MAPNSLDPTPPNGNGSARLRRHEWLAVLRAAARSRRGAIGLSVAAIVVAVAVIGPFVAPHSATEFVATSFASPSRRLPLGSDLLGRDVLSRVLDGGWLLLIMAVAATVIGTGLGAIAGITAAYFRGWPDGLIMRAVDIILCFPQIVFALLLVSIAGPRLWLLVVAVGVSHAPQVARVIRSASLDICEKDYVKAVELLRIPSRKIIAGDILPNLVTPLMVEIGLRLTWSIVIIAGLSFIGFGLQPPAANWGLMLNENRIGLVSNPWAVIVPAILVALLTVGTNTFTDAVARVSIGVDRPLAEEAGLAGGVVDVGEGGVVGRGGWSMAFESSLQDRLSMWSTRSPLASPWERFSGWLANRGLARRRCLSPCSVIPDVALRLRRGRSSSKIAMCFVWTPMSCGTCEAIRSHTYLKTLPAH